MKRLAMMAVTGVMVFALSACGDDAPPMPDTNAEDMQMQQGAAPAAAPAEAMPAGGAMGKAAPTDEQVTGATAQE